MIEPDCCKPEQLRDNFKFDEILETESQADSAPPAPLAPSQSSVPLNYNNLNNSQPFPSTPMRSFNQSAALRPSQQQRQQQQQQDQQPVSSTPARVPASTPSRLTNQQLATPSLSFNARHTPSRITNPQASTPSQSFNAPPNILVPTPIRPATLRNTSYSNSSQRRTDKPLNIHIEPPEEAERFEDDAQQQHSDHGYFDEDQEMVLQYSPAMIKPQHADSHDGECKEFDLM